jgi:hypothetical protein
MAEEDHLIGVQVKDGAGVKPGPGFALTHDQYGVGAACELKKPKFLLVQGEKNVGDDPRGRSPGNFLCYKAKCGTSILISPSVAGEDQFSASHALTMKKAQLVCAPFVDPTAPRFVDNGDGTVSDTQTGLMWEQKDDLGGIHDKDNQYSWSASTTEPDGTAFTTFLGTLNNSTSADGTAISGCFAGRCDWRLPTSAELQTILLAPFSCGTNPCIDPIFGPTQPNLYWSGTTNSGITLDAWAVRFSDGFLDFDDKSDSNSARAVRGGS